jgi:circadian clock protein KaiB
MKKNKVRRAVSASAKSPATKPKAKDVMRLFVAGDTAKSRQAVVRVRQLFEAELKNGCELEVIDICLKPQLARINQIVATPTLIVEFEAPARRFIGNLSNANGISAGLDLIRKDKTAL